MFYKVFYDMGNCEGWYHKTFDSFSEAIQFAEEQEESEIVGLNQVIPLAYNINLLY